MPGDAAGAGKGLSAETAPGVRTGPDEAEAEEEPKAVREVMIQLHLLTICLTHTRVQIYEVLADFAHHEVSGDAGVLHLKLVSVTFQDVKADSFASVKLGANSAFRNAKTAAQTFEFVVPPEGQIIMTDTRQVTDNSPLSPALVVSLSHPAGVDVIQVRHVVQQRGQVGELLQTFQALSWTRSSYSLAELQTCD